MKQRIIGTLVLLAILAVLYVFTDAGPSVPGVETPPGPAFNGSDRDFKDLKIN